MLKRNGPGWTAALLAVLFILIPIIAIGQTPTVRRQLLLNQKTFRLRPGEATSIPAPVDDFEFVRAAKVRTATVTGRKGFVFGLGTNGEILLAASLTTPPGEYAVTVSARSEAGEERAAVVNVVLNPLQPVPSSAAKPPVILLNGLQLGLLNGGCPISSGPAETFGSLLPVDLRSDGVPVVYFFDNCVEDANGLIEDLGSVLGQVMGMIRYDTGAPVPKVDLIGHSMGGLIIRSYLAGLRSDGSLSPPLETRVRKVIQIATPNFGSFLASPIGQQMAEMAPGSAFLWNLATWNGRGDDLRGVDALALIGNLGYSPLSGFPPAKASDGVVSVTSASLSFARDSSRTRILPYCHRDFGVIDQVVVDCQGPGIANALLTEQTIRSFLLDTTAWQSIGTPLQDPWLSRYGGMFFENVNANNLLVNDFTSVSFGTVPLSTNGSTSGTVFYKDLVFGTDTFHMASKSRGNIDCGPVMEPVGSFTMWRCKSSPIVSAIGPLLTGIPGRVVQSGGTATISGVGFGSQCSACGVLAYPGPVALTISSWTDQAISVSLPSTFNGIAEIVVQTAVGSDAMTFMTSALPLPPVIALSLSQLQFSFVVGGPQLIAQLIGITNSGGGTLTWTAMANVNWISLSSTPNGLSVAVNPAGLTAGTYRGVISFTAPGAAPQTATVTLTVGAAPVPVIALSLSQLQFSFVVGGPQLIAQLIRVTNSGGGTLTWTAMANMNWISLSSTPNGLSVAVNPAGLTAGTYRGVISFTAPGAAPQTATVTLTVGAAPVPAVIVTSITNSASGASGSVAPGEIITIKGSGLGPTPGVSFSVDPSTNTVATALAGSTVLFGGFAAPITYTSAGQINAIVPYEVVGQTQVSIQVQFQGTYSTFQTIQIAGAAPAAFTFNSTGSGTAVAANQDATFNGPSSPAAKGSYVTIYFTGGGQTNPVGATGSITGAVLKRLTQPITVTVGGQAATAFFAGSAPGLLDGVGQLNIQLSSDTPSGPAQPLVITVGGISSPTSATLAVE